MFFFYCVRPDYPEIISKKFTQELCKTFRQVPNTNYFYYVRQFEPSGHNIKRSKENSSWYEEEIEEIEEEEEEENMETSLKEEDQAEFEPSWQDDVPEEKLAALEGLEINPTNGTALGIYPFPLFMRLEAAVSSHMEGTLPTFTVMSVPTPQHPLVSSNPNSSISLRLICLALPAYQRSLQGQLKGRLSHLQLPLHVLRYTMKETNRQIRSLLSEEILQYLLQVRPVTREILGSVKRHLGNLVRSSNQRFIYTVPLFFLDVKQGRKLFSTELERCKSLCLKRADDMFFLTQPSKGEEDYNIPYWLLITYRQSEGTGDTVKVYFHAGETVSMAERSQIFATVKDGIQQVCKRVNQLLLLKDMYDTKVCSSLLVPEDENNLTTSKEDIFFTFMMSY